MMLELFPTRVAIEKLPEDRVLDLATLFAELGEKDWELLETNLDDVLQLVSQNYGGTYEIADGWVRSGYSSFDIHCDSHYGNQFVAVVQLYGEESAGGDLVLYDPAWRNPQYVSDSINPNTVDYTVPFVIGQVIIFPADVWHRVTNYTGGISRITLNLMIRRVS